MPKIKSLPLVLLILCLTAPLFSTRAEAQAVATVIALRGTVAAQDKSGASRNLSLKSQIFQEDVLKTGNDGQLQIMFTDSTIIRLGRDSEMKIAEYRWQPEQKDGALRTQVKEGTFRVMGGALAKEAPQNFKTETPTATIGIRGSMYAFRSTSDSLSVVFQGGRGIEIFNDHGRVTITTPGFGTQVILNAPPARPSRFTEQNLNDLNRDFNGGGGNSGDGSSGSGGSGRDGAPLADTNPTPTLYDEKPVLPPINELPSAPGSSLATPTDGIFTYTGGLVGYSINTSNETNTISDNLSLIINWYNRRILGIVYGSAGQDDKPAFFFGSADGTRVSDLTIFGADYNYNSGYAATTPKFISGSGYGTFTGAGYDFFSFAATGNSYLVLDSTIQDAWVVTGAGQQVPSTIVPVPRGTNTWRGFATGLSTDPAAYPYSTPSLLFQSSPDNFTLTVNKDAGTISGTLSLGHELNNYVSYYGQPISEDIDNLRIGGSASNSVYVRDDLVAALITEGDGSPNLKTYGNFMVVADPEKQFSTYVTWGYWQIAYVDNVSERARILATPHSLWIAGSPSTDSVIRTGFTGTYSGGAVGTKIETNGTATSLTGGTCNLTADFNAASPITSGNITFPGYVTLTIANTGSSLTASPTSNSFTANISGGGTNGSIKGAFFGPAANAVGGNFYSSGGGVQYLGIFGGK